MIPIYVYVLYDPDDFSRQATHEKTYWEKNLRYRVVTKKQLETRVNLSVIGIKQ